MRREERSRERNPAIVLRLLRRPQPHGGLRHFHRPLTSMSQLISGLHAVKNWSRYPEKLGGAKPSRSTVWEGPREAPHPFDQQLPNSVVTQPDAGEPTRVDPA